MINLDITNFLSTPGLDMTIATFKGSISAPAGGSVNTTHLIPGLSGKPFFSGTYIIDGFSQQNDIGGLQYFGTAGVGVEVRGVEGGLYVRSQNGTGTSYTISYSVAALVSPQTPIVESVGIFAASTVDMAFYSEDNHQKIDQESTDTTPWVTGASLTGWVINHTRGTNPRYRIFIDNGGYMYDAATSYSNNINYCANNKICLWTQQFITAPYTLYVRIYYD